MKHDLPQGPETERDRTPTSMKQQEVGKYSVYPLSGNNKAK